MAYLFSALLGPEKGNAKNKGGATCLKKLEGGQEQSLSLAIRQSMESPNANGARFCFCPTWRKNLFKQEAKRI